MGRCPPAVLCCQERIKQLSSPGEQGSASPLMLKAALVVPVPVQSVHLTCCGVAAKTGHRGCGCCHHVCPFQNVSAVNASMRLISIVKRKALLGEGPILHCAAFPPRSLGIQLVAEAWRSCWR